LRVFHVLSPRQPPAEDRIEPQSTEVLFDA